MPAFCCLTPGSFRSRLERATENFQQSEKPQFTNRKGAKAQIKQRHKIDVFTCLVDGDSDSTSVLCTFAVGVG